MSVGIGLGLVFCAPLKDASDIGLRWKNVSEMTYFVWSRT